MTTAKHIRTVLVVEENLNVCKRLKKGATLHLFQLNWGQERQQSVILCKMKKS